MKPISLHAGVLLEGSQDGSSAGRPQFQHMDEYESEAGSASKGSGVGPMPLPQPEDDWVEELPRPITQVLNNFIDEVGRVKRSVKSDPVKDRN